jgi:hypothetical protein
MHTLTKEQSVNLKTEQLIFDHYDTKELIGIMLRYDNTLLTAMACEPTVPSFLIDILQEASTNVDHVYYEHACEISENELVNQDVLHGLYKMPTCTYGASLIRNPSARAETLIAHLDYWHAQYKSGVNMNSTRLSHLIERAVSATQINRDLALSILAKDKSTGTLKGLLDNENTDADTLENIHSLFMSMPVKEQKRSVSLMDKMLASISKHKNATQALLRHTFEHSQSCRVKTICNTALPIYVAMEWVQEFYNEQNIGCIKYEQAVMSIAQIEGRLISARGPFKKSGEITGDLPPELMQKLNILSTLNQFGYNLRQLFNTKKSKVFVRTLIGSAHKEEVTLFTDASTCVVSSISALQYIFTKQRKLDRYTYLKFLTQFNQAIRLDKHSAMKLDGGVFDVTGNALALAVKTIGLDGIMKVAQSQDTISARDTFNMIAAIVDSEYEDETEKQIKLINRWINKNQIYTVTFHDYLCNKEKRDMGLPAPLSEFYQSRFSPMVKVINSQLAEMKNEQELSVYLPENWSQLRRIGTSQRHCVGGYSYAQQCTSGRSTIFTIMLGGAMKHGFTFQFDSHSHVLLQSEGFCRARAPEHLVLLAGKVMKALNQDGQLHA